MTTSPDDSQRSRALGTLTQLARGAAQPPSSAELDRGLNTLLARVATRRTHRSTLVRRTLVLAALTGCLLTAVGAFWLRGRSPAQHAPAIAYRVEGGSVLEGGYLREAGNTGVKLYFSEGSRVSLMPGARGRLRSLEAHGARVVIDHGVASFEVTHTPDPRWFVEAGPFSVAVKGTLFSVSWDPASERFELRLKRGRVVVSGPLTGGDIALSAGQRLLVNLPKAETLISEEGAGAEVAGPSETPAAPASASSSAAPADESAPHALGSAATPAASGKAENKPKWTEALASGEWDRILEDVERAGLDATLERASSQELFALADAARYRRRTEWARAALLAQRRRFPRAPRSVDAAYLLGRVEESWSGGRARAIDWYDEYLARAGGGAYAAEALGRKMILTNELKGRSEARPLAEEYLRRFPAGSYAGSARALSRVP